MLLPFLLELLATVRASHVYHSTSAPTSVHTSYNYYRDDSRYPIITLPAVYVSLGEDTELRCSKVIRYRDEYGYSNTFCDPAYGNKCQFTWTDSWGNVIPNTTRGAHYTFQHFLSYDYCAAIAGSETMAQQMGLGTGDTIGGARWQQMVCLNSVIKIPSAQAEDLGGYKCSIGPYLSSGYYNSAAKTYLHDRAATRTYVESPNIQYLSSHQAWDYGPHPVLQCVTSQGIARWKFRRPSDFGCDSSYTDKSRQCEEGTWMDIEQFKNQDRYMCFNSTIKSVSLNGSIASGVETSGSLSLLKLDNISCRWHTDIVVYCIEDEDNFETGSWTFRGTNIYQYSKAHDKNGGWYDNYYWERAGYLALSIFLVFLTVGLLFIAASIVTCVRASGKSTGTATIAPIASSVPSPDLMSPRTVSQPMSPLAWPVRSPQLPHLPELPPYER